MRRAPWLGAALLLVVGPAVTGCTSTVSGSGAATTRGSDFHAGLLPAAQFDPLSAPRSVSADNRHAFDGTGGILEDAIVTPSSCADVHAQPGSPPGLFAGQALQVTGSPTYVQVILSPYAETPHAPQRVAQRVADCPRIRAASRAQAQALEFSVIGLPALGEDSIAVRMDTAFGPAGVLRFSYVTAYVADGERLLVLELSGGTAAVEREMARFGGLVRAAYEYQHDALG